MPVSNVSLAEEVFGLDRGDDAGGEVPSDEPGALSGRPTPASGRSRLLPVLWAFHICVSHS
jgi:hypothetical protein